VSVVPRTRGQRALGGDLPRASGHASESLRAGETLASHGYTVLDPRHPGSDLSQQRSMLAGESAAANPDDMILRPMDIRQPLDAAAAGTAAATFPPTCAPTRWWGMPSWGATDCCNSQAQRPSKRGIIKRCRACGNPSAQSQLVLQCSFLESGQPGRAG